MLKNYQMPNGRLYQYEEGHEPEGAVLYEPKKAEPEVKAADPKNKAVKPANKTRKAATK